MPFVGYDVTSIGLYTRVYFAVHEPRRVYMIDKYGISVSAGGIVSAEGTLGHYIEEGHGWSSSLDGCELSIQIASFWGKDRTTVSLAYFTKGAQFFSFTHRPVLWGGLLADLSVTKVVKPIVLDKMVPQFPVKEMRKGIDVWNNIFS